jgi:putative mRNA 3-end processing factor
MKSDVLQIDDRGLACPAGGFHIDPWGSAEFAVITHAHADHARRGSAVYHCTTDSAPLLRSRLGADVTLRPTAYGERFRLGDAVVSLHPAGHVLGSAQVRVEVGGEVWVASGDYKRAADPTCAPFEAVACDVFITEATFSLPIYRWDPTERVAAEMLDWWIENAAADRASVLFCYSLGKAQRAMAEIAREAKRRGVEPGPIHTHGAIAPMTEAYRAAGVALPETRVMPEKSRRGIYGGSLTIAPPSAAGSTWMRRFGDDDRFRTAAASGWMRVRGVRRRAGHDRGFVLSDHADWLDLLRTIEQSGARRVLATHGNTESIVRHLRERGVDAAPLRTPYGQEED